MKKNLLPFIFTFIVKITLSQSPITLTSATMPGSGDTIWYSNCNPNSVDITTTGAAMFWNYDTLVPVSQGRYDYLSSLLTPYAFYFFGFNQYGLKIADSVGFGTFKFYDVYNFFKKTSASFATEGTGFKYQGIPLASNYSNNDEIYTFPLDYQDHDSTTYKVTTQLGTTIYYSQVGYRINDVDGWGSIKTPYDSVACLRLVSTQYGIDSINFNGFGFSFPNIQRSYKWVSVTEKIPMLEVSGPYQGGNFNPIMARYRDNFLNLNGVGINEIQQDAGTKVFPNPASNELYVFSKNPEAASVNIYNLTGALVATFQLKDIVSSFSTAELSNGCYFYSVKNKRSEEISSGKIMIAK
ncbi:MAG: T9SS type A sorting domain-containing protein [Bacteroidia bacterium]|nr:T9SS type A sorting domain-containing protein [Bacteroidia bacterium]